MEYSQEKWQPAIDAWRKVVSKYPQTNEASQAQFQIAVTTETKLGKLEEALKEYKKVTWGRYQSQAMGKVSQLTRKEMTIASDRVFRTNETPKIKLTSRNIEELEIKIYTVDLETYFRKMHMARGVEGLDIALIDPDKTFTYKVPEYEKLKSITGEVEIDLPELKGAGVMAVTVSSKTLEATTLVLRSDMGIVVKSSREEVFVFCQNMLTGKPWPNAKLLVSDGTKVFAEATTGDDGVFQKSFKQLKNTNDVRVFAIADGSTASNVISLSGLGVSRGLADKGYIYTDRPAYRPGQLVHVRGVIRHVVGDEYLVDAGKTFDVRVFDPRGRELWQGETKLNTFGSFHCHMMLPNDCPQGDYRVDVRENDKAKEDSKQNYQGTFLVHDYKLEPIRIKIKTPRNVYYRGEEITGTIRVAFYSGLPLANRTVQYNFANQPQITAKTDANGEVKFKLLTKEFRETQQLPLVVRLPERNLATAKAFILATRGFSISLKSMRNVYLAGETFETTITTTNAEGKPTSQVLEATLYQVTFVDGERGEKKVATKKLTTEEKTGAGAVVFTAEEGGEHFIRVVGKDRFENPIVAAKTLAISGDKDTTRLRILANKHTYKVGDSPKIRVHWREKPTLALVTYQGAKVLGYRIITLKQGDNKLPLEMTSKLAPNFNLAVAVMTDARKPTKTDAKAANTKSGPLNEQEIKIKNFHEASSPFVVLRKMNVTVAIKNAKKAKPGDEVEVLLTATDPQGKPLVAELSLAMIEQNLLDNYPGNLPEIQNFFRGISRISAIRTTSSVTFNYRPKTKQIDSNLLAERERRELEREETLAMEESMSELDDSEGDDPFAGGIGGFPVADLALGGEGRPSSLSGHASNEWHSLNRASASGGGGRGMQGGRGGQRMDGQTQQRASGIVNQAPNNYTVVQEQRTRVVIDPATGNAMQQTYTVQVPRLKANNPFSDFTADLDIPFQNDGEKQTFSFHIGLQRPGVQASNLGGVQRTTKFLRSIQTNSRRKSSLGTSIAYFQSNGQWGYVNVNNMDEKGLNFFAEEMAKTGAVLIPAAQSPETAYWNPSIVTDADGRAVVKLTVPERSTAWKLMAKGITAQTLAGEGTAELVAKKDLYGELKLPAALVDGDRLNVVATVHNDLLTKGTIEVTLKTTIGNWTQEETKTIDVKAKGLSEIVFETNINRQAGEKASQENGNQAADDANSKRASGPEVKAHFTLTVKAGKASDMFMRSLPIKPYGMMVFNATSGTAVSDTTAWISLPKGMNVKQPAMQIVIGPNVEQSLLDILFGTAPWCQIESNRYGTALDTTTSDLMVGIALSDMMQTTQQPNGPESQSLDARVRASLGSLVSSQRDDGAWSWCGTAKASGNIYLTARVVWAMSLAKKSGYSVPDASFNKAVSNLQNRLSKLRPSDHESRAILLHALTMAGKADFSKANSLYRSRQSLSGSGLSYLALTFIEMKRKSIAGELLTLQANEKTIANKIAWCGSNVEQNALYALALQQLGANNAQTEKQIEWLMAHRTGHRWSPDKATGIAALALTKHFGKKRFQANEYKLTVFVNNTEAAKLKVTPTGRSQILDIPNELLAFVDGKSKQTIRFQMEGRGQFTYQVSLGGFVAAKELKSTTNRWQVKRTYTPHGIEKDGKRISAGWGVVDGNYKTFTNPLTQLPVGDLGHVTLSTWRSYGNRLPANEREYLVITEPIPSGTTVVEKSISGSFERFEISSGEIKFYIGVSSYSNYVSYDLRGYLPGEYVASPTVVRNAYAMNEMAIAPAKKLKVLPFGEKSNDAYRLTPDEMYALGKHYFDKKEYKKSAEQLEKLFTTWNLRPEPYKHTVRMLLDASLEQGPPHKVVQYFEIMKEKWPKLEIPFDKILKIGAAYHEMGEYERSYMVFRATVESSFLVEVRVAGFLDAQGEFLQSVKVMSRLLQEYPPEPYVASAEYALAQQVFAKADEYTSNAKFRARMREKKLTRISLVRQSLRMLSRFLTSYPEDPSADQGAYTVANGLLELKQFDAAIEKCKKYIERYEDSSYIESYWFTIGYSQYVKGEHEAALATCKKVSDMKRKDKRTGRMLPAENRWEAVYILGQIHHSLGQAAEAITEYTRVKDRFPDAAESIAYFTRKELKLPEVIALRNKDEKPIDLAFRNVASCELRVYKIDLMKFSLMKRNLKNITKINLAGIRPYYEAKVDLGDGKDYRDRKHTLKLPLKDVGAYLVVCMGSELHTSGLVLISPLAVEVQEFGPSGRLRATVRNVETGKYMHEANVRVIGSMNTEFTSGKSDLRGVFIADGIQGTSTVIAQTKAGDYAFFRGKTLLGNAPVPSKPNRNGKKRDLREFEGKDKASKELLKNVFKGRGDASRDNGVQLQKLYLNDQKGVQIEQAK